MLVAAIAHRYSFTYKDYKQVNTRQIVTSVGEKLTPPVDFTPSSFNKDTMYKKNSSATASQNRGSTFTGKEPGNDIIEEDDESMPFLHAFIESTIPKDFIRDLDILRKGAFSIAQKGVGIANETYQNYYGEVRSSKDKTSNPSSGTVRSAYGSTSLDVEMSDVNIVEIDI